MRAESIHQHHTRTHPLVRASSRRRGARDEAVEFESKRRDEADTAAARGPPRADRHVQPRVTKMQWYESHRCRCRYLCAGLRRWGERDLTCVCASDLHTHLNRPSIANSDLCVMNMPPRADGGPYLVCCRRLERLASCIAVHLTPYASCSLVRGYISLGAARFACVVRRCALCLATSRVR